MILAGTFAVNGGKMQDNKGVFGVQAKFGSKLY
jgi:hypothetical protein